MYKVSVSKVQNKSINIIANNIHEILNVFSSLIREFKPLVKIKNDKKMQAETITTIELNILFFTLVTPNPFYSLLSNKILPTSLKHVLYYRTHDLSTTF